MSNERPGQFGDYWLSKRRGSEKWCRTWFDQRTRQTCRASLDTVDFEQAKLTLAKWVLTREELSQESPHNVLLDMVWARYYEQHGRKTRSADAARHALKKWSDFFDGRTVASLNRPAQKQFEIHLKTLGHSDGYTRRIFTIGRAALNWCHRNDELESVPFIHMPTKGDARDRVLTMDECADLFNAVRHDHMLMYLLLAFNTLARPEAILQLQPFQVNYQDRIIQLNPRGRRQTKKRRPDVPITNTLLPWLRAAKSDYLVNWHGKPVKSVKTAFKALRRTAGLTDDVIPYTIRHTMATELRRRGVSLWELQGMMGHKVGGVTEDYAKYAPDYLSKAVEAIDDYFNDLQPKVSRPLVLAGLRVSSVLVDLSDKT